MDSKWAVIIEGKLTEEEKLKAAERFQKVAGRRIVKDSFHCVLNEERYLGMAVRVINGKELLEEKNARD